MRTKRTTILLTQFGALIVVAAFAIANADTVVVRGNRIYVAPEVPPIDDGIVVVVDAKIVAVGPKASTKIPADARTTSCDGGTVVAGFHNSHVHFTGDQFVNARRLPVDALTRALVEMLTRYGFTTATDTGSDPNNTLALRARIEKGEILGPRILTVGTPIYPPDGVPFYLSETLPKEILATLPQPHSAEEAVKIVNANFDAGTDGTKLFIATPQRNQIVKRMPPEIAAAAVSETHRRGKLAMTHPTDMAGVQAAVAANVDIVVHTTLGDTKAWPKALVNEMIKKHVSVVPTLQLWPYELKKSQASEAEKQKLVAATLAQLKGFSVAGGQVLFGTDVGYMTEFDPSVEYELMSKAGLAPMQILTSLTTAPSARWKESSRRGRIASGMDADLVVLDGDPAKDVTNFAKVRCTIRGGKTIYAK